MRFITLSQTYLHAEHIRSQILSPGTSLGPTRTSRAVQIRKQLTKHSVPHFCSSLSSTRNLHCLFVMGFSILHCCLVRPLGKWHPTPSYSSHALFWCHPPVRSSMGSASWNSVFTDSCYLTHTISHHLKPKHLWPVEDSVFPSCPRVPVGVILSGALRRDVLQ